MLEEMYRYLFIVFGAAFFYCSNQLLLLILPSGIVRGSHQAWKWGNIANSLLHSLLTGPGALWCFYQHPAMAEDLITGHTSTSMLLVAFSMGYFFHDSYDMLMHHRKRSSYELLVHHACVTSCFGLAVVTEHYVGYAVVALLVEVNSVFLHYRQLLVVQGTDKSISLYRLTALLNVATFLVFRIAVMGWMTRWIVINRDRIPHFAYTVGSISLAVVVLMNIVLFLRICTVDFGGRGNRTKSGQEKNEKSSVDSSKTRPDRSKSGEDTSNSSSLRTQGGSAASVLFARNATVPEVHLD